MKKILYILPLLILFTSCSNNEVINNEVIKQDFFIETKNINEFSNELDLKKTGILSSSQDIKLTSQVSGRVGKIYVKEGEYVRKGDIIARLEDSVVNYGLTLERVKNSLNKAQISYESTENQLNKQISDIKINLDNLKIDETNSKSSLELAKIENTIKKLALDFDNLKVSNIETISGFKNSMGKDLNNFSIFLDDVIDFSDKLLGVTSLNEDKNDSFEDYLGAKDSEQKRVTEELLRDLINYKKNNLNNINYNFEGITDFDNNNFIISNGYIKINKILNEIDLLLDNSIASIGSLPDSQITIYKSKVTSFRGIYTSNNTSFITLNNSINSFLKTFENNENSLLKQIELLESDRKIYVKGLDINLEINESTLKESISNKNLTLRQLDTVITDARITYKQALINFEKLGIKSPISGSIGNIAINIGQEVGMGTLLFNISNNSDNEVDISFSKDELNFINSGDLAYIEFDNIIYTGSIYSISNIADSNLNYVSKISFDDEINLIGNVVKVIIPFHTTKLVLPVNIMKVNNLGMGTINIFNNGVIEKQSFKIGNIYSDKIEILEDVSSDLQIIITDIDNFDKGKFELKIK